MGSKAFIEWLNEELRKRNWSQNELAHESGLTSGMISRVLSGQRPGLEACKALAETFAVDLVLVLQLAGHLKPAPVASWEVDVVMSKLSRLSGDDREDLMCLIDCKLARKRQREKSPR
jgi:transcriptional regulator with XRE-family HTH domain